MTRVSKVESLHRVINRTILRDCPQRTWRLTLRGGSPIVETETLGGCRRCVAHFGISVDNVQDKHFEYWTMFGDQNGGKGRKRGTSSEKCLTPFLHMQLQRHLSIPTRRENLEFDG